VLKVHDSLIHPNSDALLLTAPQFIRYPTGK
jgi:hypothetical protein